ncbi:MULTISPECIES: hypothetical protein [Nocardiopsidaceae]|uniref:Uncharacterized protein n=1 Tax=Streptomonospora salina TaxID=104205 RepID=A0A841EE21_9ACTN|nr:MULTISPECIES: hypothetical protein [Nocardiopsaceae]MBB5999168.1 hypothetical protein [Streptomonospora salina]
MSELRGGRRDSFWDAEPASLGPQPAAHHRGRDPFAPAPPPPVQRHGAPAPAAPGSAGASGADGAPAPPPSEPPARVGSAVAALLCALLTLLCPLVFVLLGFPMLSLLIDVPAIVFGIVGLTRLHDPMEVERCIRYTWACILVYLALMAVILAAAIMVVLSFA